MIGYARNRRRYKESWLIGYKLSTGIIETAENPTDDNYIALACAILCNISSKKALQLMDLCPDIESDRLNDSKVRTMGTISYILNTICGIPRKKVAEMLSVHVSTINDALRHNGLYRDGRSHKNQQEE